MNNKSKKEFREPVSIEELERTLADLRSAVRAGNPLLKAVASSRLYPALSLVLGLAAVAFCFMARNAARNFPGLRLSARAWIFLAAIVVAGVVGKVLIAARLAVRHGKHSFYSLMTAIYGGKTASMIASSTIAMLAGIFFLISIDHPWYIVPIVAIYTGLASHALDLMIDLPEYRILGWVSMASGIVSLFFIEADPLLWTAVVTAAIFVVFGFVGLALASRRGKGRRG